jgi:Gas vesicle protein G
MMMIDDIVVFPFKSLLMVFREIYSAAIQELEQEGERIRLELGQLYMSLETGGIDEAAFDERERDLLDRLDELEAQQAESEDDEEDTSGAEEQEQEDDECEDDDGPNVYLLNSEQET